MTKGVVLAKQGLCEFCQGRTSHGPWTDAQMQEVCHEVGIDPVAFGDTCDDCFVAEVGRGDAVYAQSLVKRPLELQNSEYQRQLKFMAAGLALQAFRDKYPDSYRQRREESARLFQELMEHAPAEVLEQFRTKAKELDLLPKQNLLMTTVALSIRLSRSQQSWECRSRMLKKTSEKTWARSWKPVQLAEFIRSIEA